MADLTLIVKLQLLRKPIGTQLKCICQQCRSRVSVKVPGVSFLSLKSYPALKVTPHLGVRFTLPLKPSV